MDEANVETTPEKDQMLINLIKTIESAEDTDSSSVHPQYILINTGGLLINGQIISADRYYEILTGEPTTKENTTKKRDTRDFLHLSNAKYYLTGSSVIPGQGEGFLWRGKLSAIDGFSLAKLETVDRAPQQIKVGNLKIEI